MSSQSKYICQQCGYESVGWMGKCPECGTWNSLVETLIDSPSASKKSNSGSKSISGKIQKLSNIKPQDVRRTLTKISELDRVLGGGLVKGQAILIAGEPGIGKSTLLMEVSEKLGNTLYVCGEESAQQVAVRAHRLGVKKSTISLLEETDVDEVINTVETTSGLSALIVDSIQTMTTSDLSGMAGSVGQVRESAFRLVNFAKSRNIPVFMVGHVTKEGTVAGPAVLAHMVDTVLWFEGDKTLTTRILRAVKNRFGPTDEVGIFEMKDEGLKPMGNIEKLFVDSIKSQSPGSIVGVVMQGTRPILTEIQALVIPTRLAIPRRVAQGIDPRRLEMILAVLTKKCGLPLYDSDVFINVVGGIKITDTSADLAIALAVASSHYDKPIGQKIIAVGEVGLLGEIRGVIAQEKRIKEARRLGYPQNISSTSFKNLYSAIKETLK